jgi:hypothetical protein
MSSAVHQAISQQPTQSAQKALSWTAIDQRLVEEIRQSSKWIASG